MIYYASDDRRLVVRHNQGCMERFDYISDKEIENRSLGISIFLGEPLFDTISEDEAKQCIEAVRQEKQLWR